MANGQLTVYWDGTCPFCTAVANRLKMYDVDNRLNFVDYHDGTAAALAQPRFTFDDLSTEMHLSMPDGSWRIGYYSVVEILKALPTWRWLGLAMNTPLLADVGPRTYRWVADHRDKISNLFNFPAPHGITATPRATH